MRPELRQRLEVVPGHPRRRIGRQFACVPLQLGEVVERIGVGQFAGVDQAHEQIADFGAVQRAIEQSILAMQHGAFERAFADVVVQRCAGFPQKRGQPFPVPQ